MQQVTELQTRLMRPVAQALEKGAERWYTHTRDSLDMMRYVLYSTQLFLAGSVFPGLAALLDVHRQVADGVLGCFEGQRTPAELLRETARRLQSGARFPHLVDTVGKQLFGSARFDGEEVLHEDRWYRLTYIPPKPGSPEQPTALFHAGGLIPYGDGIFRALPETNFFAPWLSRGIPVYAMELKGDRFHNDYSGLDVDGHVDSLREMTDRAFGHGRRRLVLEGYCGHGTQLLPYLAAMPEDVQRKVGAVAIFVSPVDGRECTMVAEPTRATPEPLQDAATRTWAFMGGYAPGSTVQQSLDLSLKVAFDKTPLGRFLAGWKDTSWADVDPGRPDALTPAQRRDLAGHYWISPDNGRRYPVPVGLLAYTTKIFTEGIGSRGEMPGSYRGRKLTLADFRDRSSVPVFGIFGGRDTMILDRTAYCLVRLLGERYTHVVHMTAGHISYCLSAAQWDRGHRHAFDPDPIDLLLKVLGPPRAEAPAAPPAERSSRRGKKAAPGGKKTAKGGKGHEPPAGATPEKES